MKSIVQDARKLLLEEIEQYGVPSLLDFQISEKKVLELVRKLKADKTIALVGYYLMDIELGNAIKLFSLEGRMEHVKMGVKMAGDFLRKYDLDEKTKKKIINCIEAHHGTAPFICKEAEICANADCYRFLLVKGFLSMLITFKDLDLLEEKVKEKWGILSLDICKKELEPHYKLIKEIIKKTKE